LSCDPATDSAGGGAGVAAGPGVGRPVDVGVDSPAGGDDVGEAVTGTGVASDKKSQPHDSQNRPVRGAEHTGQGSPAPSAAAGADVAGAADEGVEGVAEAIGGAPIRAPHSSQ
jgi:hypothetical protein